MRILLDAHWKQTWPRATAFVMPVACANVFGCFYLDTTQRLSAVRVQMHDSNGNTHLLPVGSVLPQHCRMKPGGFTNDLGKEGTSIFCFQQFADE